MAKVEIYTWSTCPFCVRAKGLLDRKGVAYSEVSVDGDEPGRDAMAARGNGKRSVPQIFIDDQHVGGCDELHGLERAGKLDALLAGQASIGVSHAPPLRVGSAGSDQPCKRFHSRLDAGGPACWP